MIEKGVEMFDTLFCVPKGCFREFREFREFKEFKEIKEIKEFEVFPFMLLIFNFQFSIFHFQFSILLISFAVVARGEAGDALEVLAEERLRGEVELVAYLLDAQSGG